MSDELELKLEDVKYLLPPDLLKELFGVSITPQHAENQPTNGVFIAQPTSSNHHQLLPISQGVENNVPSFLVYGYTWVQILRGDHLRNESPVGTSASLPPLTSTVRCQKAEGGESKEDQQAKSSVNGSMQKQKES